MHALVVYKHRPAAFVAEAVDDVQQGARSAIQVERAQPAHGLLY